MTKLKDYFNSTTIRGRANVAKATYASIAALYLYSRFKKSKNPALANSVNATGIESNEQKPQGNGKLEHYKCPHCESDKEKYKFINKNENERKDVLHEATRPTNQNQDLSPLKPDNDLDNSTEVAESIVKFSEAKCEPDYDTTSDRLLNDQQSINTDLLW